MNRPISNSATPRESKHDAIDVIQCETGAGRGPEGNKALDKEDYPGGERPKLDKIPPKGDKPGHQQKGGDHHRMARSELHEAPEKADRPYHAKDSQKKEMGRD